MVGMISKLASTSEKKTQEFTHAINYDVDKQTPREVYSITYALPGQVGFCVPRISKDPQYCQRLTELLKAEPWVKNVQVNSTAGSILVNYITGEMSDYEMRSHFSNLIQTASEAIQPANSYPIDSQIQGKEKLATLSANSAAKVAYSIDFATPGQVGFSVPRISTDAQYYQRLLDLLKIEPEITDLQINSTAGSIVIIYKFGVISDLQMRSHFGKIIECASDALIKNERATIQLASSNSVASQVESKRENKQTTKREQNKEKLANFPVSLSCSQKPDAKAMQPATKIAYSIAHAIPGRVRFRVPRIGQDQKYVQRLQALLKADPTVISERVNRAAASIVITYKSAVKLNTHKKRDPSVLETAISHLASLLQYASDLAVA